MKSTNTPWLVTRTMEQFRAVPCLTSHMHSMVREVVDAGLLWDTNVVGAAAPNTRWIAQDKVLPCPFLEAVFSPN